MKPENNDNVDSSDDVAVPGSSSSIGNFIKRCRSIKIGENENVEMDQSSIESYMEDNLDDLTQDEYDNEYRTRSATKKLEQTQWKVQKAREESKRKQAEAAKRRKKLN